MNNQKELIDKIVGYRVRNGLSMREMAIKCGISYVTLFNIENQKHKPTRTIQRKILNVIENEVL